MNAQSKKLGYVEGWVSIAINVGLFGLKLWAGLASGSVAIIADAWHTLSDSLTSVVVLVGFKVSAKPADGKHPFGHGRAESIAAVVIAVLLAVVGFNFMVESVSKLRNHESAEFGILAVVVFAVSTVLKEGLAQFSFWAGRKTGSSALAADGWHHRSDSVASGLILGSVFLGPYFWWIDGVLGIGVALLILYAVYGILKESVGPLVGERPGRDVMDGIRETAERAAGASLQAHCLGVHRYGSRLEVTMHVILPGTMTVTEAGGICRRIENALRREKNMETTVRVESDELEALPGPPVTRSSSSRP